MSAKDTPNDRVWCPETLKFVPRKRSPQVRIIKDTLDELEAELELTKTMFGQVQRAAAKMQAEIDRCYALYPSLKVK